MTIIDRLYDEHQALIQHLNGLGEISFGQLVVEDFRKHLTLAIASLFEQTITDAILEFCRRKSSGDPGLFCLVRVRAVERQYFTYFDWKNKTANAFFGMFGDPLGVAMKTEVAKDSDLKAARDAFLEIGYLRNCLVHQNFATFAFEKTAEEVYRDYQAATKFVTYIVGKLCDDE